MMESPQNYDIQAAERLFKKVVHPGLNTMRIVDRNGLPVHSPVSQIRPRSFVLSPRGVPTKVPDHAYSGKPPNRYTDISTGDTPELISPERFGRQSAAGSPDSKPTSRQYSSSHMSKKRAVSTTPVFNRAMPMTKSASTQRYLSGVPNEKRALQDGRSRWNTSSQGCRLENEWDNLSSCRALKRSSEEEQSEPVKTDKKDKNGIVGHRVDRMYFMSGNSMKLQPRYHVDEDELLRLQEMAKTRQVSRPARSSRLGRMSIHSSTSRKSKPASRSEGDITDAKKSSVADQGGGKSKEEEKKKEAEKPLGINGLKISTGRKSPLQGWGAGDGQNVHSDRGDIIRSASLHNNDIDKNGDQNEERNIESSRMSHDVHEPIGTEVTDTDLMFDEIQRKEMEAVIQEEENEGADINGGVVDNELDNENNVNHRLDGRKSREAMQNGEDNQNVIENGEDNENVIENGDNDENVIENGDGDKNVIENNDENNDGDDFNFVHEDNEFETNNG